jgi:hypothetical protein
MHGKQQYHLHLPLHLQNQKQDLVRHTFGAFLKILLITFSGLYKAIQGHVAYGAKLNDSFKYQQLSKSRAEFTFKAKDGWL